jgi:hypothetical protein
LLGTVTFVVDLIANCLSAGVLTRGVARKRRELNEPKSGVPTSVPHHRDKLCSGRAHKNDPNDARSVAITAMRVEGLQRVSDDEHAQVLRWLAKRHRDLGQLKSN